MLNKLNADLFINRCTGTRFFYRRFIYIHRPTLYSTTVAIFTSYHRLITNLCSFLQPPQETGDKPLLSSPVAAIFTDRRLIHQPLPETPIAVSFIKPNAARFPNRRSIYQTTLETTIAISFIKPNAARFLNPCSIYQPPLKTPIAVGFIKPNAA